MVAWELLGQIPLQGWTVPFDEGFDPVMGLAGSFRGIFTAAELEYLQTGRKLARLATVGTDGTPHVTPVGWHLVAEEEVIEVGGIDLARTKKFRDVVKSHKAAIVIDEVLPPWRPRGIEIRGRAEAIAQPESVIRIYPQRIISWGLDDSGPGRNARDV